MSKGRPPGGCRATALRGLSHEEKRSLPMTYNDPKSVGDYLAAWLAGHERPSAAELARYRRVVKGLL